MDRILSTRLDESLVDELQRVCKRLGVTKKRFLEEAIREKASTLGAVAGEIWEETCGAWARRESASVTIRRARNAFERSMKRRRRSGESS